MRKADLIRENERIRCRVRELENILCHAAQHDFHDARLWYEPDCEKMFAVSMLTCRELICKRCFARKVVKTPDNAPDIKVGHKRKNCTMRHLNGR